MRLSSARRLLLGIALLVTTGAAAQSFDGGFPFLMPPEDSMTVDFLPAFPVRAITESDFISTAGDDFHRGGEPIRFWGANFVADGAFPQKSESGFIAGRYRKMGFNLARFHHLDNPWSDHGIFPRNGSTRTIDEVQRDRLEFLIHRLKEEGVYVNMNLNVSRTFTEADGVADADSLVDFGKGVTLFDPQLIELQKEYAQQILTHTNPYTGLALADDPVLAMVEIANENSLYLLWRNGQLSSFSEGGTLIQRHVHLLDDLWSEYIGLKYGTTEALQAAWAADVKTEGPELVVDGGFEQSVGGRWQLEQHGGAVASVVSSNGRPFEGMRSAEVRVATRGPEDWRVQWKHIGLSIEKDTTYTVRFAARADKERSIPVGISKNVDPWTSYAGFTADVGTEWRSFEFTFAASESVANSIRLSFITGGETGSAWFDAVSIRKAGSTSLDPGETIETARRLSFAEVLKYSTPRLHDMTEFYLELQTKYFEEMETYLKNDLRVRVPISRTNWNFGIADLAVQADADYIDNHAYWDHPVFPNEPWSETDWSISNTSMLSDPNGSTIARLMAGVAMADKPYTVSEYNHAFPNRFQTEAVLMLGAYASLHDVDGIMFFDYNASDDWTSDRVGSFFSIHNNPALMALMPSMAKAYRDGLIPEAEHTLEIEYSAEDVLGYPAVDGGEWGGTWLFPRELSLEQRIVTSTYDAPAGSNLDTLPQSSGPPFESDTRDILWDTQGLLSVNGDEFLALTGFLNRFEGFELEYVNLAEADGFGTLTWIPLDGHLVSGKSLLTVSSASQNTNMIWDGNQTVHNNWGAAPTLMQPLRIVLSFPPIVSKKEISRYILLHTLDGTGTITSTRRIDQGDDGVVRLELDQSIDRTAWYGLETFLAPTSTEGASIPTDFSFDTVYPNPADEMAYLGVSASSAANGDLEVFDVLGRRVLRQSVQVEAGLSRLELDVSSLAAGIYQVRVSQSNNVATKTLVVR